LHRQKWRGRIGLALVASLSVLAGMTDAIGFMASGDFVSFMSGNTTRLAVAISDGDFGLTLRLVILVVTFVIGNALGIVSVASWSAHTAAAAVHRHPARARPPGRMTHNCRRCWRRSSRWACSTRRSRK
jgi:uncharacterized membrane protein YoaK (UPF0700 family)